MSQENVNVVQSFFDDTIVRYIEKSGYKKQSESIDISQIAKDILAAAKEIGLPAEQWITESFIKYAFGEVKLVKGKGDAIEWMKTKVLPVYTKFESLPNTTATVAKQYLLSQEYSPELFERILKSDIRQSDAAVGNAVPIDGVQFMVANPIIIKNDPEIKHTLMQHSVPGGGKPFALRLPSTVISRDVGRFTLFADIQITNPNGTNLDNWEVGIIQNVKSKREVIYENGKKFYKNSDWVLDATDWSPYMSEKGKPINKVPSGQSVRVVMADSPFWAAPDEIDGSAKKSFEVKDEFRAFIVVKNRKGEYKPLFKQEWEFTSDGSTASYTATGVQRLMGNSGGLLTAGKKANELKEEYK